MRRWPSSRSSWGTCGAAGEPRASPRVPSPALSLTVPVPPRDKLQLQNQLLQEQLQDMRQHSGGNGDPAVSLSLLALLLLGMLLL